MSKSDDLIRRADAIKTVIRMCSPICDWELEKKAYTDCVIDEIKSLPSAEPKTGAVLCALADRTCPFQGKEFAWCLTCPHISEEDRDLVKKAIAVPKTMEWIPVSEKPKDEERTYLVQLDSGGMRSCRWTNANPFWTELTTDWHWNMFDIPQYCNVVAWMDLEPYKGGEDK